MKGLIVQKNIFIKESQRTIVRAQDIVEVILTAYPYVGQDNQQFQQNALRSYMKLMTGALHLQINGDKYPQHYQVIKEVDQENLLNWVYNSIKEYFPFYCDMQLLIEKLEELGALRGQAVIKNQESNKITDLDEKIAEKSSQLYKLENKIAEGSGDLKPQEEDLNNQCLPYSVVDSPNFFHLLWKAEIRDVKKFSFVEG